jgi:hypothetical protein
MWEGVGKREFPVEEGLGKPRVSQDLSPKYKNFALLKNPPKGIF